MTISSQTPIAPPIAAKRPHSETHHGITVVDDYAWLRDGGLRFGHDALKKMAAVTDYPAEARGAAERLCRVIEQAPFALPGGAGMIQVTLSIGLAVGGIAPETPQASVADLLSRADLALLRAKAEGRNKVTVGMNAA